MTQKLSSLQQTFNKMIEDGQILDIRTGYAPQAGRKVGEPLMPMMYIAFNTKKVSFDSICNLGEELAQGLNSLDIQADVSKFEPQQLRDAKRLDFSVSSTSDHAIKTFYSWLKQFDEKLDKKIQNDAHYATLRAKSRWTDERIKSFGALFTQCVSHDANHEIAGLQAQTGMNGLMKFIATERIDRPMVEQSLAKIEGAFDILDRFDDVILPSEQPLIDDARFFVNAAKRCLNKTPSAQRAL